MLATFTLHAQNGQWVSLFNGKDLTGWKQLGGEAKYEVKKNEIAGIPFARRMYKAVIFLGGN